MHVLRLIFETITRRNRHNFLDCVIPKKFFILKDSKAFQHLTTTVARARQAGGSKARREDLKARDKSLLS